MKKIIIVVISRFVKKIDLLYCYIRVRKNKTANHLFMKKTNALRILDRRKIPYKTLMYQYDEENLSVENIAMNNGLRVEKVFKTLLAKGDKNGVVVAVISGKSILDFKALAKISKNKKIALVPVKELLQTTGYIRGGCSPIGMKKPFPIFVDSDAEPFDEIYVNAGVRGLLVKLRVQDLLKVTNGILAEISRLE